MSLNQDSKLIYSLFMKDIPYTLTLKRISQLKLKNLDRLELWYDKYSVNQVIEPNSIDFSEWYGLKELYTHKMPF